MKNILYITLVSCIGLTIMISCSEKEESSSSSSSITEDISFDPSSVPDNGTTVAFGQSYQYQVTTDNNYSGTITYSLSNQPDGMTISSTGLIEWTPSKSSEITTHSNIKITITTASGYVLTQTYDLTVTGTCVSGNVLAIWTGDQRSSTDSSKFLSNITAYTDNASDICGQSNNKDCTPWWNYDLRGSSVHLTHGPTAVADKGNMFFYNQYDNASYTFLFWNFGVDATHTYGTTVHIDAYTASNTSPDIVIASDDNDETSQESQNQSGGLYSSTYTTRATYSNNYSDGAVIGPFSGSNYRIFVDLIGKSALTSTHSTTPNENTKASGVSGNDLGLGELASFKFWSKDNSSFDLGDNASPVDNFTVGYSTTLDCSN